MNYIALIRKEADSDFGVDFPDFPGCVTAGTSLDEAKDMAAEALSLHIEGILAAGLAVPGASSLDTVMADLHNTDAVAFMVSTPEIREKAVRVNVTFPESVLHKIDAMAKAKGTTRSGFLKDAALEIIGEGAE